MADFDVEGFPRPTGTPPSVSQDAVAWAREVGYLAGAAGWPPTPPPGFAPLAKPWCDGWRLAAEKRKPSGWREADIDFDWKER